MHKADRGRMERLCGRLVAAYQANEYPFNLVKTKPPQYYIPDEIKANGRTYAYFLFVLCLWMRGGIASDTAAKSLVTLYEIDERLFDAYWVRYYDPMRLNDLLDYFGLGRDSELNAELWIGNAALLVERWYGDPRFIFHDFGRYSEVKKWKVALQRIMNKGRRGRKGGFGGFKEKMTSMLIYYLAETGLIEGFDFPVPVDFHVTRMMVIHKVYKLEPGVKYAGRRLAELLDAIRYETYRFAKKYRVSSIELVDALWLYSRSMCSRSPGFKTFKEEDEDGSFIYVPYKPKWSRGEMRSYARTCGRCVVHDTCGAIVRATYWYTHHNDPQGNLHVGDRLTPHQLTLLPPEINRDLY